MQKGTERIAHPGLRHQWPSDRHTHQLCKLWNEPRNTPVTHDPTERQHFGQHGSNCRWSCYMLCFACVLLYCAMICVCGRDTKQCTLILSTDQFSSKRSALFAPTCRGDHLYTAAKKPPTSFGTAPFSAILGKYTVFVPKSSRCHPPYQSDTNHPERVRALCIFLHF